MLLCGKFIWQIPENQIAFVIILKPKFIAGEAIMIFVTGGTGFVGSFIIRKLLAENKQIKALRRKDSDVSLLTDISSAIDWVEGDITDITFLYEAMQGCEQVIHAAAITDTSKKREEIFNTNVEGTANLVNISLLQGIKKFCYISSVLTLGRKNEQIINEESKWEESKYNSLYAQSKYAAEKEVSRAIAEGLNAIIVNPSLVLGLRNQDKSNSRFFEHIRQERPFYTHQQVNYVDVRDVAEAVFQLTFSEISGENFILNAGSIPYKTLADQTADLLGKKKPTMLLTPLMLQMASRLEYLRSKLTGSRPLVTRETAMLSERK
ncbi:MAG: NAD-dependent epimerase/dehydratase family protein, partial [Verrucomicrobia bacterium]|nr:NAD-dependent epimerase/dehydratase family protein [Cytophagales bacterium]